MLVYPFSFVAAFGPWTVGTRVKAVVSEKRWFIHLVLWAAFGPWTVGTRVKAVVSEKRWFIHLVLWAAFDP